MKPLFIVVEALDAVGKTTLVQNLAERLDAVAMNTPGPGLRAVSDAVLLGLGAHQEARCLFYAASVLARGAEARSLVDRGRSVVMDRYWLSTIAYARARGVTHRFAEVEALVPVPDVTVVLTLDEDERVRRMTGRGNTTEADRETLDSEFQRTVNKVMMSADRLEGLRPTLRVDVSGCDPEEAVHAVLQQILFLRPHSPSPA